MQTHPYAGGFAGCPVWRRASWEGVPALGPWIPVFTGMADECA